MFDMIKWLSRSERGQGRQRPLQTPNLESKFHRLENLFPCNVLKQPVCVSRHSNDIV